MMRFCQEEPKNVSALVDKATTLQNLGDTKDAIQIYERAIEIDPQNIDAYINMGAALHSAEKI